MATTPNAQLTKLAIGIASVAAIAGISGKLAAQPPVSAQQGQATSIAATGNAAINTNNPLGGPAAPATDGARQYQSPAFSGFSDDEGENEEHEHSFFGSTPVQPQAGSSSTFQQQAPQTQQQQTRRTRSKHS